MKKVFITVAMLAVCVFVCPVPRLPAFDFTFSGEEAPVPGEAIVQQGVELYEQGRHEEALSVLRGFVVRRHDSPLLPRAYLYLARILLDRDRPQDALLYLDRIPADRQDPEVLLVRGASLVASGKTDAGTSLLRQAEEDRLGTADRALRLLALADADARQGRPLAALALLQQGLSLARNPHTDALFDRAHRLLADRLNDSELAEAAFMFRDAGIGADALLQQALRAEAGGETDEARRLVDAAVNSGGTFPYRRQAVALWERLAGESWLRRKIGVLLPQSGRYASFGNLVRRGMELARQVHDRNGAPVEFVYRDTAADPDTTAQAVTDLVNRERVVAIAGPLTGAAAMAAAEQAQADRVPLLALSQRQGLPETGDFVFRDSLTNRLQARALARYAVEEKGMSAFGVLYPDNRLGRELTRLFGEEVLKLGGLVVAREGYPEGVTDFGRQIKLLKGEDPDAPEPEEIPLTEEEILADLFVPDEPEMPAVDFDALFIPDYADQVGLIAPQLAYYGIEDLPLLGINGWNSPDLVRDAGSYVEGAVFVDGFFRYSTYPFVRDFVDLYFETYGEDPSILEAQGYDAAGILLSLIDQEEILSREGLRLALARLQHYPGVTGATTFDMQGDAEKVLFLLQVQNGNIVQIN